MKTFTAKFHIDNAAFDESSLRGECATILRDIAIKVESGQGGYFYKPITDSNGNSVGGWRIAERRGPMVRVL